MSFNCMAAITICSDSGAQKNKVSHCFHCFSIYHMDYSLVLLKETMPCGATQNGWVMMERSDRMWSTGKGNSKLVQYSCLENPMNSMKRIVKNAMYLFCQFYSIYSHHLEKAMAPHSSTLAWKIPWTEEPGRLQSMGSRRVGHD